MYTVHTELEWEELSELIDPQSLYETTYPEGTAFRKLNKSGSWCWECKFTLNVVVYCCCILHIEAVNGCFLCGGCSASCCCRWWWALRWIMILDRYLSSIVFFSVWDIVLPSSLSSDLFWFDLSIYVDNFVVSVGLIVAFRF